MATVYYTKQDALYNNAWDSWAESEKSFAETGLFKFSIKAGSSGVVCGIAQTGIPEGYQNIAVGIYAEGSRYKVILNGSPIDVSGNFNFDTIFRIEVHANEVKVFAEPSTVLPEDSVPVHIEAIDWFLAYENFSLYSQMYAFNDQVVDASWEKIETDNKIESELPALEAMLIEGDVIIASCKLPKLKAELILGEQSYIDAKTRPLMSYLADDDYIFIDGILPGLVCSANNLAPFFASINAETRAISSLSIAAEAVVINADLPQLIANNVDCYIAASTKQLETRVYIKESSLISVFFEGIVLNFGKDDGLLFGDVFSSFDGIAAGSSYVGGELVFSVFDELDLDGYLNGAATIFVQGVLDFSGELESTTYQSIANIESELGINIDGLFEGSASLVADEPLFKIDGSIVCSFDISGSIQQDEVLVLSGEIVGGYSVSGSMVFNDMPLLGELVQLGSGGTIYRPIELCLVGDMIANFINSGSIYGFNEEFYFNGMIGQNMSRGNIIIESMELCGKLSSMSSDVAYGKVIWNSKKIGTTV